MTKTKKTFSDLVSGFLDEVTDLVEEKAREIEEKAKQAKAEADAQKPSIRTRTDSTGRKWLDAADVLAYVEHPRSNQATLRSTLLKALGR